MKNKPFEIELIDIHWLEDTPEEIDLCAHGQVKIKIGNEIIVDKREKGDHWTLSAMAIHLLRTVERNHTPQELVEEHLIPCCGHHIDHLKNEPDVHIQGCFTGVNYWVNHKDGIVELTTESGTTIEFALEDYKDEIKKFVDKVEEFYKQSKPKKLPDEKYDRIGYRMLWKEWKRRRNPLGI